MRGFVGFLEFSWLESLADTGAIRIDAATNFFCIGLAGKLLNWIVDEIRVAQCRVAVDISVAHRFHHQPRGFSGTIT